MRTINLLPKSRQEELRYQALLKSLWVIVALSFASFGLVFLVQFGVKFYLQAQTQVIKAEIADLQQQVKSQQNADVKDKVQAVNNLIGDYKALSQNTPKWSKVIKAFAPLPPSGLKVTTFTINPVAKSISISGISPTRELVIQLYNNILKDTKDFNNVDYPLENVATPVNINFHFTFFIQDSLLH